MGSVGTTGVSEALAELYNVSSRKAQRRGKLSCGESDFMARCVTSAQTAPNTNTDTDNADRRRNISTSVCTKQVTDWRLTVRQQRKSEGVDLGRRYGNRTGVGFRTECKVRVNASLFIMVMCILGQPHDGLTHFPVHHSFFHFAISQAASYPPFSCSFPRNAPLTRWMPAT